MLDADQRRAYMEFVLVQIHEARPSANDGSREVVKKAESGEGHRESHQGPAGPSRAQQGTGELLRALEGATGG